ncbi:addiction module protein [Gracilimonas mengyeensis]|uniref:Putative addiction module component, TIGR02574 family n=1 Tax=Gracilimonas mengyeensis TaxID=1302730 RepID=A0A521EBN7_9BACT|nr:addiction module protein [Gracilimonas mengyeensis]SMO80881.1 putative addiction module component, TIGR02574 family [Gracilimonas mengyeensis]
MIDENIKKKALKLSLKERAELAHMLIDSLHPESEFESEEAWSEELKRRIDRYEQGKSAAKPWSEVRKKAHALIDR